MTTITCIHPNCHQVMPRGRTCCGRHWAQLTTDLRKRLGSASSGGAGIAGTPIGAAIQYFQERMKGEHEITFCRGADCGADIIWMISKKGKSVAVNADTVMPNDDRTMTHGHVMHFKSCPNANDFRSK